MYDCDCGEMFFNISEVLHNFKEGYAKECCIKAFGSFKEDVNAKFEGCLAPLHRLSKGYVRNPPARENILKAMRISIEYGADPHAAPPLNYTFVGSTYDYAVLEKAVELVDLFDGCCLDIKEPDC